MHRVIGRSSVLLLIAFFVSLPAVADLPVLDVGSGNVALRTGSLKEARFSGVSKQKYDYSCGSAAVATLLTHHYGKTVSESDVFHAMYQQGDQDKIKKQGFSLMDIKGYLNTQGYRSDGFKITLDTLIQVGVPAIALINRNGYKHFVVVKGVRNDEVLIGDPSLGIKRYRRDQFESMWNGLAFLIRNKKDVATVSFNLDSEWSRAPQGSLDSNVARNELANSTWLLRPASDF